MPLFLALALTLAAFQSPATAPIAAAPITAAPIKDEPLTLPAIVYPAEAKHARIQGTVHLEVTVDPTGHVTAVRALDGPIPLRQAAIDAYSRATYAPLTNPASGRPTPAVIATSVDFTLHELPPDTDLLVDRAFQPLQAHCQSFVDAGTDQERTPEALAACREAVAMSHRFTPAAALEARAAAVNDLVLILLAQKSYPGAALVADEAVSLVASTDHPHTPAAATAYITRCEARSLARELPGAAQDCAAAEETLLTLIADQSAPDQSKTDRTANYKIQLRETYELHAIILDKSHHPLDARRIRNRAKLV